MPFMYAAAIGTAASAGTGIANTVIGANAASDASKVQQKSAADATAFQRQMYDQTVQREQPFVDAGTNALANLQKLLGIGPGGTGATSPILQMLGIGKGGAGSIDPKAFYGSPGYNYELNQGLDTITNRAAARGGLGGNALLDLQRAGQGMARGNFNNYFNEASGGWNSLLSLLGGLTSGGQAAANTLGAGGAQLGGQVGSNLIGAGNSAASGIIGNANAVTGGLNSTIQSLMTLSRDPGLNRLLTQQMGGGNNNYSLLDPANQSVVGSGSWNTQPDSYFLPGGGGYAG